MIAALFSISAVKFEVIFFWRDVFFMAGDDFAICRDRIHSAVPAAESKKGRRAILHVCVGLEEGSAHIASLLASYVGIPNTCTTS